MGLFDTPAATPAPAPQPVPSSNPDFADFYKRLLAAAALNGPTTATSMWDRWSGAAKDRAIANAEVAAPQAYQALQGGQTGVTNGQLGTLQTLMFMNRMNPGGAPIDPNNVPASFPGAGVAPQGAPAPATGAPGMPPPQAQPAENPLQAQRARWGSMVDAMTGLPQYLKDADSLRKDVQAGAPTDTVVTNRDGIIRDGITGQALVGGVGQVKRDQVAPTKALELQNILTGQTHQGNVDVGVHTANANTDAARDLVDGIDTRNGLPVTRSRLDILNSGAANFAKSNPYFDGQQAEIKERRASAESADQGLNMGQHIINAANGIFSGKGANTFQEVRKLAQTAAQLTGAPLSDAVMNDTSKFEQLKFASQQLAAVAAHALSARTSNMLYGAITAVKPGDATSMKGLRDIITNEVIPEMLQVKARYKGTAEYYQKNPLKNDAASTVSASTPLDNYRVKSVHDAKPGDYFIDPVSGNLRQRSQ